MDPEPDDTARLVVLERRRLAALVRADLAVAEPLHAEDYQLITPGGAALSKTDYLDGVGSGRLHYRLFEPISPIAVRVSGDLAVLRYRAHIRMDLPAGTDAGHFWHTDVYERREGRWRAAWSQATRTREDPQSA